MMYVMCVSAALVKTTGPCQCSLLRVVHTHSLTPGHS